MEECEIHPGNTKHFYCSKHPDVFCVDCGTDKHLACRDVTFLSEISEASKSMLAHLRRQMEGFQYLIEDSVRRIYGTEQKKEETLQYVEQVRSDFNKFIDNLKQDVNTRYTQFQSDIRHQIRLYEEHIQTIETSLSKLNIQILLRHECKDLQQPSESDEILSRTQDEFSLLDGQSVTMPAQFDLLKHFERQLQDDFENMEVYSQATVVEWTCSSTQTAAVQSRNVTTDCLDLTVLQPVSSQTDLYHTSDIGVDRCTLQYSEKVILSDVQVPVKVAGEDSCYVAGCALVQDCMVVIVDWINDCVKLAKFPDMIQSGDNVGTEAGHQQKSTGRGSVLCKLELSCKPGDVTAISQNQVAVILPYDSQIQILKVEQEKLTSVRKISKQDNYRSITYGRGIFVMAKIDTHQKRLTVATLQGEKVSVVKVLQYTRVDDGKKLLYRECYIAAAKDRTVYVTNSDDGTVTRLTLTGEVLGQYKFEGLREPLGICVHPTDGTVFICYCRSHCILRMSPDGQEIQRFKVSYPLSVCVTEDNKMSVCRLREPVQLLQLS